MYSEENLWTQDVEFIDKLVSPVFKDIIFELMSNKKIDSSIEFIYKYHRSYVQVSKYKRWLSEKGFIEIDRTGKKEAMRLTKAGKRIATQFMKLVEYCKELDGGVKK